MINRNGRLAFPYFLAGKTVQSEVLYDINNEAYVPTISANALNTLRTTNNMTGNAGMVMNLGVGTTPPTADDLWLDNVMVNGVDVNTIVKCVACNEHPATAMNGDLIFTYSFWNSGNENISISEIALSYYYNSYNQKVMFARKVIPTRVIQPRETVTFSYVISFS